MSILLPKKKCFQNRLAALENVGLIGDERDCNICIKATPSYTMLSVTVVSEKGNKCQKINYSTEIRFLIAHRLTIIVKYNLNNVKRANDKL
jgi:hypothetical protein